MQSLCQSIPGLYYALKRLICTVKGTVVKTEGQVSLCVSDIYGLELTSVEAAIENKNPWGFEFF